MDPSDAPQTYLEPSELGTKKYWDSYYQNDLDNEAEEDSEVVEVSELDSWFDDVGAPAKTLTFLTSESFPLSPNSTEGTIGHPTVLDIGTGNGSALLSLALEGGYRGSMVGLDYSEQSIELARKLQGQYVRAQDQEAESHASTSISFEVFDLIRDDVKAAFWWPHGGDGFDLVLDKGTFDAISLSSEITTNEDGVPIRIFESYPTKVASMVKPGGFFLLTSCNWTQDEVIQRFTTGSMKGILDVYRIIQYPVFQFGGQQGQGVASVCFRKPEAY